MSRLEKEMSQIPQKTTPGYDGPYRVGTRVTLVDSKRETSATVWQEPTDRTGPRFRLDELNSGGWAEIRFWHGEVIVDG